MAKEFPNPSEPLLNLNRRRLLTTALGTTAASLANVTPSEAVAIDPANALSKAAAAPVLNVCARTAARLLQIEWRNKIRREANLPALRIASELRRMKEVDDNRKFSEAFGSFVAKHSKAVWDEVLEPIRKARNDPKLETTLLERRRRIAE